MPLYEYQCDTCGHRFEVIRKFSDPPLDVCPKCGAVVRKLQSAPAIQFKGTGFYITDYPKKNSGVAAGKSGESEAAPAKDAPAKEGASAGSESSKSAAAPASSAPSTSSPSSPSSSSSGAPSTSSKTKSST